MKHHDEKGKMSPAKSKIACKMRGDKPAEAAKKPWEKGDDKDEAPKKKKGKKK